MRTLGLDLGAKTCGIAISNDTNSFALGLINFHYTGNNTMLIIQKIKQIMRDYNQQISKIVLGYPYNHETATINSSGARVDKFKILLLQHFPEVEIDYMDENFSTIQASTLLYESDIKASQRKKVIDMISAVVILQNYLDRHKTQ